MVGFSIVTQDFGFLCWDLHKYKSFQNPWKLLEFFGQGMRGKDLEEWFDAKEISLLLMSC
jgi:hypothetical protein